MSTEGLGRADVPFDGAPNVAPPAPPGEATLAHLGELLQALQAVRDGDFSVRLPGDWVGLEGKIADTFNDIVAANAPHVAPSSSASATSSASEGRTRERAEVRAPRTAPGARWRPRSTR